MSLLRKLSTKKGCKKKGLDKLKNASVTCDDDDDDKEQTDTAVSSISDIDDGFTTVYSYRLTCSLCHEISYTGDTEMPMANALLDHYMDLWNSLQEKREGLVHRDSVLFDFASAESNFGHSPLGQHIGQHILKHCQDVESKADVLQWCQDNVRVQVKMHKYESRKTDGTFKFTEDKKNREFVKNKHEREVEWEETKKQAEAEKEGQIIANSALNKDKATKETFDTIWNLRYNELKEYAAAHEGDTNVPQNYAPNILLGRWAKNQRVQYRRKHNGTDKNPALSDMKEELLNDFGFAWCFKPKSRNDSIGIAVIYGYTIDDFNAVLGSGISEPNIIGAI